MSIYIEDAQGKIVSEPINETNSKYPYIPYIPPFHYNVKDNSGNSEVDYQYMYNDDNPISNIDTNVYDAYRDKVEELRTKTESYNEALEACLVPTEIEGMSYQPWEYKEEEDDDGNKYQVKIKSLQYFFQDHPSNIGSEAKEFVFHTNKVKFFDDRHRRLIYDRQIHIMSSKEDEDNGVTFKEVLYRTFFTYYNNAYVCMVRNIESAKYTITALMRAIIEANTRTKDNEKIVVYDDLMEEKTVTTINDFDRVLVSGQDINTTIPSSVYNLYNIGWIQACMIFLNGLAIEWTKALISVDNIDTFVIATSLRDTLADSIDNEKEIKMDYVYIPFKCIYMIGAEDADTAYNPYREFLNDRHKFDTVAFMFDKRYGSMIEVTDYFKDSTAHIGYYDRVICVDKDIVFSETFLTSDVTDPYLPDIGVDYNESFRDFCNHDYRCKLKQFNFLGFEYSEDISEKAGDGKKHLIFKNGDFSITWHPFNILDLRFKHLYNNRRFFKIFYNTKVLYDQDNILRIKNHDRLYEDYEKYRRDIVANIEIYMNELYVLTKKDIGSYVVTSSKMYMEGRKYHYVSPYECFLIFNALQELFGSNGQVSFDAFRKLNMVNIPLHTKTGGGGGGGGGGEGFDYTYPEYVYEEPDGDDYIPDQHDDEEEEDTTHYIGYLNGGFIVFDDEHNFFSEMVKEETLFDSNGVLREEIRAYWQSIIDGDSDNKNILDFLIPIDDLRNLEDGTPAENNIFYMYSGDNRGKVMPYAKIYSAYEMVQEYDEFTYDYLKIRFEMSYLNNVEEGATPIDEFIYYFDNAEFNQANAYPVVNSYDKRYTALLLNALAYNIFKYDPHSILDSIVKLNYSADYIIPPDLDINERDRFVTYANTSTIGANYQQDPRYFYNFGYRSGTISEKLVSEWGLRRSLTEMFVWALDDNDYTISSMHLLDEVFDFTYSDESYISNLHNGANYIMGYDADKLEAVIKRGIVSMSKTGKEIKTHMTNHPAIINTSTDNYKMVTFVTNSNYIVSISLEKLYAYISNNTVHFRYVDGDGIEHDDSSPIELRFRGQQNATIIINTSTHTIKDVDKDFTVTYDANKVKYNNETQLVEFYDSNNQLLVTLQVDIVYHYDKLQLSRWNISKQDNYVMIFKNKVLYDKYYTIHYSDIAFDIDVDKSDTADDDVFEFIFFLNANNTIIEKYCSSPASLTLTVPNIYYSYIEDGVIRKDNNNDDMDKGLYEQPSGSTIPEDYTFENPTIACNTSIFEPENLQLLVNKMPSDPNDEWSTGDTTNTAYELSYEIYSYRSTTYNKTDVRYRQFRSEIMLDSKINGLYRVTKQGGGEYFISFDGTVPENNDTIMSDTTDPRFVDHGYSTNRTVNPPYKLYLSSKRQFRYQHYVVREVHDAGYMLQLNPEFKYCTKFTHVLVFKNGLLLPPTYYYIHSIINTPLSNIMLAFNVPLEQDDEIDIFYVTNPMRHIECDYYDVQNQERYISNGDIRLNVNDNEYRVMGEDKTQCDYPEKEEHPDWRTNYIKMRSPLYAISSKHSTFVFLNGKKVRLDELEDISDTIMSIKTDYARNNEDMQAVRLEVLNFLDNQDIIEQLFINDGLSHNDRTLVVENQFNTCTRPSVYKNTLRVENFSLAQLEAYAERTKLDEILNDLSDENLNKLFYNWNNATGPMTVEGELNDPLFIKIDEIVTEIIDEFYYEEDGDKFLWHTEHGPADEDKFSNTVRYIGEAESVLVPKKWDGEDTMALYALTFNRNETIRKVIIPEGVERID